MCVIMSVADGPTFGVWDSANICAVFFLCVYASVLKEVILLRAYLRDG